MYINMNEFKKNDLIKAFYSAKNSFFLVPQTLKKQ